MADNFDNLIQLLLAEGLEIPIVLENEFSVDCCIRGYHIYSWTQWHAEIGSILTVEPEVRPGALVEDQYAMAIKNNAQTVGHIPKYPRSKLNYYQLPGPDSNRFDKLGAHRQIDNLIPIRSHSCIKRLSICRCAPSLSVRFESGPGNSCSSDMQYSCSHVQNLFFYSLEYE